jgi:polar amino acid transport system substrate-binding protein
MKTKIILIFTMLFIFFSFNTVFAEEVVLYQSEVGYPPYKFYNNNYLTGFDIELTNMIFGNRQYDVLLSTGSWDKVYERLKSGEIDTCGTLVINESRKRDILYSKPIFKTYNAVYTRKNFSKVKLGEIGQYNIGVGKGQYSEEILKDSLRINNYKAFTTVNEALTALKSGEIDILFENQEVVNYLIIEKGFNGEIVSQIKDLFSRDVAFGFNKNRADLVKYTNKRIQSLKDGGNFEELYERYFFKHSDYYRKEQMNKYIFFAVTLIILVLISYILMRKYIRYLHKELLNEKEIFKNIVNYSRSIIIAISPDKTVIKCNKSVKKFGISPGELIGKRYDELDFIKLRYKNIGSMLDKAFNLEYTDNLEISIDDGTGGKSYYSFVTNAVFNSNGQPGIFVLYGFDITERKDYEKRLKLSFEELEATYEELAATEEELRMQYSELREYQDKLKKIAYRDNLTSLPNRFLFHEDLKQVISNTTKSDKVALLFIDIDNFKYINDSMGHSYGDKVLVHVGEKISELVNGLGTLYRLGGDEFIVILTKVNHKEDLEVAARNILKSFERPYEIGKISVRISLSIGLSVYPDDGDMVDDLLKNSDIAMYKAKESGKGTYVFYDKSMSDIIAHKVLVERHLSEALINNELYLLYQPQFNVNLGRIDGFEALIRWNSGVLGLVSPLDFINIAEESGLIISIGEWILKTSCEFIKNLQLKGYRDYRISVNISVVQLSQESFVDRVLEILDEVGLEKEFLELEITESILMEAFDYLNGKLELLKSKGIRIALDDFGTGYSSLSYLKRLKVNTLKIDKSFIDGVLVDNESALLTGSIIRMGREMGLQVIAEGVETAGQVEFLANSNCDKIQGYYYSRPVSDNEVFQFLI